MGGFGERCCYCFCRFFYGFLFCHITDVGIFWVRLLCLLILKSKQIRLKITIFNKTNKYLKIRDFFFKYRTRQI